MFPEASHVTLPLCVVVKMQNLITVSPRLGVFLLVVSVPMNLYVLKAVLTREDSFFYSHPQLGKKKNIGGDESLWDEEADGLKLQGSLMA